MNGITPLIVAGVVARLLMALVGGWLLKRGYDSSALGADLNTIAGILVAAGTMAWSIAQKAKPREPGDSDHIGPTMGLAAFFVAMILCAPGCAGLQKVAPEQRVQLAARAYQSAVIELIDLRRAGVIDDRTYRVIEPIRASAWAALQSAQASSEAGRNDINSHLDVFNAALSQWAQAVARVKATTRPAIAPAPAPGETQWTPSRSDSSQLASCRWSSSSATWCAS
jgi:hypothetical protein